MLQDFAVNDALSKSLPVGWGAPIYKMLMDDWKSLNNILAPVTVRRSEQEKTIELIGGGRIDFHSLDNPDSVRGKKYKRFIINEAAFVPDLMDAFNYVIRPTLVDYIGEADFAGTPKGMNGFWSLFNQTGNEWAKWQMSSYENPHIPKTELDALRETMTERAFQQEILAQFLEDGGLVFRNIRALSTAKPQEPEAGKQYVIGADWGRTNDATVFSVMDIQEKKQVYLDRMTNTDYAMQRSRLSALVEKYNRAHVIAESNSMGQPNIEALQALGLYVTAFATTNATKANIIQALELACERQDITLLDDEVQIGELISYQSEKLPSGLIRYGAPDGLHDDTVMALALAWHGIENGRPWLVV